LENLRFYKVEEKGDTAFAEKLSKLGTFWVNDAFGTAHRAHASTAVIAQFFPAEKRSFGFLMEGEVKAAEQVLHQATPPFTAIIGGAKVCLSSGTLKSTRIKAFSPLKEISLNDFIRSKIS
jgi:phosphoglycerate kinase